MTDPQLSVDALFELLRNDRRRYILYCLTGTAEATAVLDELIESIVDLQRRLNDEREHPRADAERRIRLSLHHTHLPKLEDAGLVEYDPRSGTVRKTGIDDVSAILDCEDGETGHLESLFDTSVPG